MLNAFEGRMPEASAKLAALGFKSCESDPCLVISDKCICLVYVDDTLQFARSPADIDAVVAGLKNLGIEEEDDVAGFLSVLAKRKDSGTIELLQVGLIQRIIEALHISHFPGKRTPDKLCVLSSDPEGESLHCLFNYASVLGMMSYLQANSRPDLSFAAPASPVLLDEVTNFPCSEWARI
jgi:hypothetical protein